MSDEEVKVEETTEATPETVEEVATEESVDAPAEESAA